MRKGICILIICLVSLTAAAKSVGKIVAKVNNEVVTSKDLDDYISVISSRMGVRLSDVSPDTEEFRKEALQSLIEDKLILAQAKEENMEIPYNLIDDKFNEIVLAYPSVDEFEKDIVTKGLTTVQIKRQIKDQFLSREIIEKYVKSKVNVLPQEVGQYYEDHLDEFSTPLIYVIWIAKSEDRDYIGDIAKTIDRKGIDYAREKFEGELIRVESSEKELVEVISKVLREIDLGDYIIREIEGMFHIVYLGETIPSKTIPLEDVRESVYAFLMDKRFRETFTLWVGELKDRAVVKLYDTDTHR
jgi:hypothetical protein